jgi:DNA-binding transcriptional LysR family regulator
MPLVTWRHLGEPETSLRGRVPDLNVIFRSDDNGTLVGLVAEGLGVAVVPQLVVNPRNPAYVALPFGNRIPPRRLAIVWHRDRYRSAAADAFVELARDLSAASSASAASTSPPPAR